MKFILFAIVAFIVGAYARLYWHEYRYGIDKKMTGELEAIRLLFGAGQIFMINGVCYHVWLPYAELRRYERGMTIEHEPFWETTRGPKVLSTRLGSAYKKNNNAASPQPHRGVPY
jgi:hypothetical protein